MRRWRLTLGFNRYCCEGQESLYCVTWRKLWVWRECWGRVRYQVILSMNYYCWNCDELWYESVCLTGCKSCSYLCCMLMSVCGLDTLSVSVYGSHVLAVSSTVNRARGHRNQSLTFICTHVHLNQFSFLYVVSFWLASCSPASNSTSYILLKIIEIIEPCMKLRRICIQWFNI